MSTVKQTSFVQVVTITSLAFVVAQLDVSIVNLALPQIAQSYQAGISTLQWVVDAYTLAFAVLMLSAGSLSDRLGALRIFQIGIVIFGIASAGCGLAGNSFSLVIFRILQGIGAATMIPSSLSLLNQAFAHEPATRARAVGLWTAAGSSALAAGPLIGGVLIHISNWRFIFYVNIPFCIAAFVLSFKLHKGAISTAAKKFDTAGQLIWMLAATLLIAAIIEWHQLGLQNPLIWGGLLLSLSFFVLFLAIEKQISYPILPLHLFNSSRFNVLLLLGGVLNGTYYGSVFVLSLYLQNVLHYPSMTAGLAFVPLTVGFVITNLLSGKVINRFGIGASIIAGLALFAVGFAGLFLAKANTPYWQLFFPFLIMPVGMGMAVPAMITGILASVEKSLSGTASAVLNTVRQTGGAIGVAAFGALAAGGLESILSAIPLIACVAILLITLTTILTIKYVRVKGN
ncbi:MFS transporter [Mucilaginibacter sp. PAMB04274]|uniref:MFS transporter n=1 Tax=Mucilaginibacter sp. PAMB04274 TaxID=3138568 RepID=UPI0031F607DC